MQTPTPTASERPSHSIKWGEKTLLKGMPARIVSTVLLSVPPAAVITALWTNPFETVCTACSLVTGASFAHYEHTLETRKRGAKESESEGAEQSVTTATTTTTHPGVASWQTRIALFALTGMSFVEYESWVGNQGSGMVYPMAMLFAAGGYVFAKAIKITRVVPA